MRRPCYVAAIRTLLIAPLVCSLSASSAVAQSKYSGIPVEHRKYVLAEGVESRDVTFYSDETACAARMFFPKGFSKEGSYPGVVVCQGWTGIADTIHKYGNRFAQRGMVAMTIDYRGWGESDGFVTMDDRVKTSDENRRTITSTKVQIKRTRLIPMKQIEDIRSAISYIQGEPGVDRERIGLWGSSYAGGHVLFVASVDPRVKAIISQVPAISGNGMTEGPVSMSEADVEDWIKRSRGGAGAEVRTGFSQPRDVDVETFRKAKEYRPFQRIAHIPESVAALFLLAENEELINNELNGIAAHEQFNGPKKIVVYPEIGHFDIYIEDHFERASKEAADWLLAHLSE